MKPKLLLFTFLPLIHLPSASAAACSRSALLQTTREYMSSLSTTDQSDPLQIQNLADPYSYLENHNALDSFASGRLMNNVPPLRVEHNITLVDEENCASYVEVVSVEKPFVLGTQMRHLFGDNQSLYLIDSIVSTTGDVGFDASQRLEFVKRENWGVILSESERDKREAIIDAADAYLDWWSNSTGSTVEAGGVGGGTGKNVPWGRPCNRLEGSIYTGNGTAEDSCNNEAGAVLPADDGVGRRVARRNRRYVIDETVGAVSVLWSSNLEGATRIRESYSHLFRLEGGKLRYVHSITVRGVYNVTIGGD